MSPIRSQSDRMLMPSMTPQRSLMTLAGTFPCRIEMRHSDTCMQCRTEWWSDSWKRSRATWKLTSFDYLYSTRTCIQKHSLIHDKLWVTHDQSCENWKSAIRTNRQSARMGLCPAT